MLLLAFVLAAGNTVTQVAFAQNAAPPPSGDAAPRIPPDQLDSLVAPIALYPDPLLAQCLAASTYPIEIIQLQQFLAKNAGLKDQALADAVAKQPWDPSVQGLAAVPDVAKRLADDIQWTTDLGNAFLAQESDVMDAVQRMRKKAVEKNNLKTTEQQVVETKVVENKSVIVIEQANPQVIYVPSYDPVVVYGPPAYPYPPIYYPPPGYYAGGMALAFGVGLAMGSWWGGGGGWGYNCGWGGGNININNNNNFIRNSNVRNGNLGGNAGNRWQHRPEHRGGTPYRDRGTADRFGGAARGDSLGNRQAGARREIGRQGGNLGGVGGAGGIGGAGGVGRPGGVGGAGGAGRPGGVGGAGGVGGPGGVGNRGGVGGAGGVGNRGGVGGAGGAGNRGGVGGAGGPDRVGNRDLSRGGGGGDRSAFGGGGRGYNGGNARASGNRGAASSRSRGGGGGRGGGGRGGGGRRR